MRVIGLMSGTSYDAVEAAAADLELRGEALEMRPLGHLSSPCPDRLRDLIAGSLPPSAVTARTVAELDTGIGQAFADVAVRAVRELCGGGADLVVSHGQTLYHWVEDGTVRGTLQLGQPARIAEATGLPVVSDLRSGDVAAGGQGAPLVAMTDALALAALPGVPAALNLGGIANVTVVAPGAPPLAFDSGSANALMDAAVRHFTDGPAPYDEDGAGPVRAGAAARAAGRPLLRPAGAEEHRQGALPPAVPAAGAPGGTRGAARGRPGDAGQAHRRHGGRRLPCARRHAARRVGRRRAQPRADRHARRRAARGVPRPQRRARAAVGRQGGAGPRPAGVPDRQRPARRAPFGYGGRAGRLCSAPSRRDGSRCACPNRPTGRPGCSASPAGPRPERRPGQGRARTRDEPPARMPSAAASVRSVSVTMVSKAVSGATR